MSAPKNNTPVTRFPLDRTIQEFLIDRQARNLSAKTLVWYKHSLGIFRSFLTEQETTDPEAITPSLVRFFLLHLSERGHNAGGVHNIFGAVKAFLHWYEVEYASSGWPNPLRKVKTAKRPQEPLEPVSIEDFQAMLGICVAHTPAGDRGKAMLLFLLGSGVRLQELTDLSIGDIDIQTGSVLVRCGKGRKPRVVFVGTKTRRALLAYLRHREDTKDTSPLWITRDGLRLSKAGVKEVVRRRAQAAGIPMPGLHAFRRAFAVNCLRNGMDVVTLQRLLGHSSLAIIHRYLNLLTEDSQASHARFGVVDNDDQPRT